MVDLSDKEDRRDPHWYVYLIDLSTAMLNGFYFKQHLIL